MQLKKDTYLQGGKYRVISTLGQGGFGITYLAEQVMAKRMVCIKEFFPKEYYNRDADSLHISLGSEGNAKMMNAYKAKFIKEAQTIAKLKHPNIIPIFDVFEENNTAYYAMEYIEGESLNAKVKREGALAEDRAVKYIRDVASALRYIHKRNIMHLDVKPANVMLRKEDDFAVLIDFGLSKQYDNAGKQTSATPVGISHGYAPIEQYQEGGVSTFSPVTDIYSLGATLHYLVTGRVPAVAASIGENGIGELPRLLSANVRNAITSAMGYWRKDRPQNIEIFLSLFDDKQEVNEVDDTIKIIGANSDVDNIPVIPNPTPVTPKSDCDDIYIKPKKSGEKSEKTKKQKSRWWIWLLILVIAATAFFALRNRGNINPIHPVQTNEEIIIDTLSTGGQTAIDTEAIEIPTIPPNNEIWYTSTDGKIVKPNKKDGFSSTIVSNTYEDGKGIIKFDNDIQSIDRSTFGSCKRLTSITLPLSVTEIGESAFWGCDNIRKFEGKFAEDNGNCIVVNGKFIAYANASEATSYNIPDGVLLIGNNAFSTCKALKSVIIPSSVVEIRPNAFASCDNIEEFIGKFASDHGKCLIQDGCICAIARANTTKYTIPYGVTAIDNYTFVQYSQLKEIEIPSSVKTIGDRAFFDCTSLTSVNIPDSVTTIGEYAFYNCDSLTSVTIGDSVTSIGKGAFGVCESLQEFKGKFASEDGRSLIMDNTIIAYANASGVTYTIPDSVTTIGYTAFGWCDSLTSVNIPDSVTTIGEWAFSSCNSLTSVTIGDSVTTIGEDAFYKCDSLTSVNIGDSVTTIGEDAFRDCDSLTNVTIPDSVTTIGKGAFEHCTSLKSVNIPDSVTTIGKGAFEHCTSLKSVNIPDSVTKIGWRAFCNCTSLTSVNIPDSVTEIGEDAFCGCSSLTSITIPNSVTTIGSSAFGWCRSLTSVTIPDSVTWIGSSAFYKCTSLTSVYCKATTPPSLFNSYVFDYNGSGRKIYVPAESVEAYKSAYGWNEYASAIVGYDF